MWIEPLKYRQKEKQWHGISESIWAGYLPCVLLRTPFHLLLHSLRLGRLTFINIYLWFPSGRPRRRRVRLGVDSLSLAWLMTAEIPRLLEKSTVSIRWSFLKLPSLGSRTYATFLPLQSLGGNGSLKLLVEGYCTSFFGLGISEVCLYLLKHFLY